MANRKKKHDAKSKKHLYIAIGAVTALLAILIILTVVLSQNETGSAGQDPSQTSPTTVSTSPSAPIGSENPSDPPLSDDPQSDVVPQPPVGYVPTESDPMLLEQGLYIVHMGNFSGRFVEDGSDEQIENFCAVIVENQSDKTLQLLQFKLTIGETVYDFRLTTLPPGERAIVQDLNRTSFAAGEEDMTANVEACLFFNEEPSLHEDLFAVSGTESGLELRNRTNSDISGPIYVYYKTRTADGYFGGITYRITIPSLEANGTYNAAVSHFWPGSSQVMFIDYAQ